jgi:hypothetical protein
MTQREDLNNRKLIEDKFIEIKTDLGEGQVSIIHNYSDKKNVILALENAIFYLKSKIEE